MAVIINPKDIDLVGNVIRYHRKRAGMSRVELATIAGIGKTAVYDIENGKLTVRLKTLLAVCAALNITLELDSPLMAELKLPTASCGESSQ